MAVYDSVDISPLDKPRKTTNKITLIFFAIFMVLYFGTAIYAFTSGDTSKIKEQSKNINKNAIEFVKRVLDKIVEAKWMIIGYLAFSIVSMLVCLCVVRGLSRIIIKIAIVLECISLAYNIYALIIILVHFNAPAFIAQLIAVLIMSWAVYVKVYVVMKVGTSLMSAVVKESIRVIFQFPGIMALSVLLTLLVFIVIVFGISVYVYLASISINKSSILLAFLHFVNSYCTFWLSAAIVVFGQMIFYGAFGTWYWATDKSAVPADTTLQNVAIAFRFHIGTIAYMSSIWVIFPIIFTMIKGLSNRTYQSHHNIFVMIVCWWNIFTRIFDSSIGATAIHGKSFKKAANTVCQLYLRFPVRLYAITKAYEWCTGVMVFISVIIASIASAALMMPPDNSDEAKLATIFTLLICLVIVMLPLILILNAAITSIFYCILEDHERGLEDRSRRCFMKPQIKELMMEVE